MPNVIPRSFVVECSIWRLLGAQIERQFTLNRTFAAKVTGVPRTRIRAAAVNLSGHHLELLQYEGPVDRETVRPRPCDVGSWHLAVEASDIHTVIGECERHG